MRDYLPPFVNALPDAFAFRASKVIPQLRETLWDSHAQVEVGGRDPADGERLRRELGL